MTETPMFRSPLMAFDRKEPKEARGGSGWNLVCMSVPMGDQRPRAQRPT